VLSLSTTITIRDLGSSNGTRLGGVKLDPDAPRELRVGDAITVGSATLLLQPGTPSVNPRRFWSGDDFDVRLEEECARARRAGAVFAVAYLAVDKLALDVGVRRLLAQRLRAGDVVGEYGPSEYVIVLNDSPLAPARAVMERIAADLAALDVRARWGVAEFPRDGAPASLVATAQSASRDQSPAALPASKRAMFVDERMVELAAFVKLIAAGELAVLVLGETGAGKEVIAEEVHRLSPRAAGPFVRLNCGALSGPLLESELFGYERGAFTSADKAKPGLLETAATGTVFLDEIGELPMNLQVKLLRVIEDKQALRVGGIKPRPLDVRFVAATNRDLEAQCRRGLFRDDLYYRLAGATVTVPPLRERPADVEPLARIFLRNAIAHLGGRALDFTPAALEGLRASAWPGNVRELRNVIERAALICGPGPIDVAHLPPTVRRSDGERSAPRTRASATERNPELDADAAQILDVLAACGGNQSRAAKQLGMSRAALIRRLEKIAGVVRPRKPGTPSH
jgi:DNA-binding NtrC family response regulator